MRNSLLNAFVLLTIAAIYLRGGTSKSKTYTFAASLLAVCFATLSALAMLASAIDATFFDGSFRVETGIFGFLSLPLLERLRRGGGKS